MLELTGEKTRAKAVNVALREYIRSRKIKELRSMLGNIDLADNLKELEFEETKDAEW